MGCIDVLYGSITIYDVWQLKSRGKLYEKDIVNWKKGEYAENLDLAHTIDLYAAESDVVGIVLSATEPYSLYPPNITPLGNRDEVGIVTKIDHWAANPQQAAEWLKLTGCKKIFFTSAYTGEGIEEIFEFLREEHDICPVEKVMDALHKESFGKQAELPHYHLQ